jgi:hypothetical protein
MTICTTASSVRARTRRAGTERCALVVFKSNFRAGRFPVAFQNKTRDQADFLQFSVKRRFQNEISLTRANQDLRELSTAYIGGRVGNWRGNP